jgi:copper chaperone CopZ
MHAPTDQLLIVRIGGMHCHRCQEKIKRFLQMIPGVHECEVDFPSAQASVIYDPAQTQPAEVLGAITELGYTAPSFSSHSLAEIRPGGGEGSGTGA